MKNPRPTPIISRNEQGPNAYITAKLRLARFLAMCVAKSCFWTGDAISRLMNIVPIAGILYPAYNNLMYWSCVLSDNYDLGMWGAPEKNDDVR